MTATKERTYENARETLVIRTTQDIAYTANIQETDNINCMAYNIGGSVYHVGQTIAGMDSSYTIIEQMAASVESDVFLCTDDVYGKLVIKIYRNSSIDCQKREKVIELLTNGGCDFIIPLTDHGVTDSGNHFDVYPFYERGDLSRYGAADTSFIINTVIPNLNEALKHVHGNRIVHRDIKPSNIYRDEENGCVVVGDFGIASVIRGGNALTNTLSRTSGYAAPEIYAGGVTAKTDYYAMGISLLNILRGDDVFTGYTEAQILQSTIYGQIPGLDKQKYHQKGFTPADDAERIELLICGLLAIDANLRWGYDEVAKWLSGEEMSLSMLPSSVSAEAEGVFAHPINIFGSKRYTYKQLVSAMIDNWGEARNRHLYTGLISNYVAQDDADKASAILKTIEDKAFRDILSRDSGMFRCLYILDETLKDFVWDGKRFSQISDLAAYLNENGHDAHFTRLLQTKTLSWYVQKCNLEIEDELKDVISSIEELSVENSVEAYHYFAYIFLPAKTDRAFLLNGHKFNDPDELVEYISMQKSDFSDLCVSLAANQQFYSWLRWHGFGAHIDIFKDGISSDNSFTAIRKFLELLESCTRNKKTVRNIAMTMGGYAHAYWLHRNIGSYIYTGSKALGVKKHFKSAMINDSMSVAEIYDALLKLKEHYNSFVELLSNNPLNVALGTCEPPSNGEIIPVDMTGYFVDDKSISAKVPLSYLKWRGLIDGISIDNTLAKNEDDARNRVQAFKTKIAIALSRADSHVSQIGTSVASLTRKAVMFYMMTMAAIIAGVMTISVNPLIGIGLFTSTLYFLTRAVSETKKANALRPVSGYISALNEIGRDIDSIECEIPALKIRVSDAMRKNNKMPVGKFERDYRGEIEDLSNGIDSLADNRSRFTGGVKPTFYISTLCCGIILSYLASIPASMLLQGAIYSLSSDLVSIPVIGIQVIVVIAGFVGILIYNANWSGEFRIDNFIVSLLAALIAILGIGLAAILITLAIRIIIYVVIAIVGVAVLIGMLSGG